MSVASFRKPLYKYYQVMSFFVCYSDIICVAEKTIWALRFFESSNHLIFVYISVLRTVQEFWKTIWKCFTNILSDLRVQPKNYITFVKLLSICIESAPSAVCKLNICNLKRVEFPILLLPKSASISSDALITSFKTR